MMSGVTTYDAVLLVSFGGPEAPEDVIPFLENVTRGRGVPPERLAEVAAHYQQLGGVSPINAQNRALVEAIGGALPGGGVDLPVYWGNRNWSPYLVDVVRLMRADGVRRALAFVTAAYSSYSGCRQYREDLYDATVAVPGAPSLDKVRPYFDHPGFVAPFVDSTLAALADLPEAAASGARLLFTTHSIPLDQADRSGPPGAAGGAYVAQHRASAALVVESVSRASGLDLDWDLVYQSRSGSPSQPWLGPDVGDHLEQLATQGVPGAVLVPIGFVSDHMEVRYDLDVVAMGTAGRLGLPVARAATPGTDPRFVAMVVDLVVERVHGRARSQRRALSPLGPWPDVCAAGCCPNPRGHRPAVAGLDP
jgi:protoporphyrin/coproporphyrin ferrochelatase